MISTIHPITGTKAVDASSIQVVGSVDGICPPPLPQGKTPTFHDRRLSLLAQSVPFVEKWNPRVHIGTTSKDPAVSVVVVWPRVLHEAVLNIPRGVCGCSPPVCADTRIVSTIWQCGRSLRKLVACRNVFSPFYAWCVQRRSSSIPSAPGFGTVVSLYRKIWNH